MVFSYPNESIFLIFLPEIGMLGCKPMSTPIEQNHKLYHCLNEVPTNKERYQKMVGKFIYLSHTILDIAYATNVVNQFIHDHRKPHMEVIERILMSILNTPFIPMFFLGFISFMR